MSDSIHPLKRLITSLDGDFTLAIAFHETWKPTALNKELHQRMGDSYASQSFIIIRSSLRRETLLALMRIWDTTKGSHSLRGVFEFLRAEDRWSEFVIERTKNRGHEGPAVMEHLAHEKDLAISEYQAYCKGGVRYCVYERLVKIRNGQLAHTQSPSKNVVSLDPVDTEVHEFFEATGRLVKRLMSLVNAHAVDYEGTERVYATYSKFFWDSARGERTEGHPLFDPSSPKKPE